MRSGGHSMQELAPVSWRRMIDAVEIVRQRLLRAARALGAANIPYAVVGGNAVAAWVSRVDIAAVRNTRDVDLLLRRSDLDRARGALESSGFIYRRIASLGRQGSLDVFLDGKDASARDALHIVFATEKLFPSDANPAPDISDSEKAGDFQLISLEALVRMKLVAFRDKDRVHLRDLLGVGLIDDSWPARFRDTPELAARLEQVLATPEG